MRGRRRPEVKWVCASTMRTILVALALVVVPAAGFLSVCDTLRTLSDSFVKNTRCCATVYVARCASMCMFD